jgi:hypothetical protein
MAGCGLHSSDSGEGPVLGCWVQTDFGLKKMLGISWTAEQLLALEEEVNYKELVAVFSETYTTRMTLVYCVINLYIFTILL